MREILFRGKRIDNGEWVEGSLVVDPDIKQYVIAGFEYYTDSDGPQRGPFSYTVDPETVGQYTGQGDFYAGDIAKSPRGSIGTIEWHDSWCAFYFKTIFSPNEDGALTRTWQSVPLYNDLPNYVKLGNRWDNPQLLEQ